MATPSNRPGLASRPELRLLSGGGDAAAGPRPRQTERPTLRLLEEGPRILIAGGDMRRRDAIRRELIVALAPGTPFGEASKVWEVLQQAPQSGVVMLAGDLQDASAQALMSLLEHRHPRLPIVVLEPEPLAGMTLGETIRGDTASSADVAGPRKD